MLRRRYERRRMEIGASIFGPPTPQPPESSPTPPTPQPLETSGRTSPSSWASPLELGSSIIDVISAVGHEAATTTFKAARSASSFVFQEEEPTIAIPSGATSLSSEEADAEAQWAALIRSHNLGAPRADPRWRDFGRRDDRMAAEGDVEGDVESLIIAHGLCPTLRKPLWKAWAGGDALRALRPPGTYANLSRPAPQDDGGGSEDTALADVMNTIAKDVARTCTDLSYFRDGDGVECLGRVLRAFARLAPVSPGYVQGMSALAAVVLLVFSAGPGVGAAVLLAADKVTDDADKVPSGDETAVTAAGELSNLHDCPQLLPLTTAADEEDAFWAFSALVLSRLRGYFDEGLPNLMLDATLLELLLRDSERPTAVSTAGGSDKILALPAGLSGSLARCEGFDWLLLVPEWFLQLFADSLPPTEVLHVWDLVLWHRHASDEAVATAAATGGPAIPPRPEESKDSIGTSLEHFFPKRAPPKSFPSAPRASSAASSPFRSESRPGPTAPVPPLVYPSVHPARAVLLWCAVGLAAACAPALEEASAEPLGCIAALRAAAAMHRLQLGLRLPVAPALAFVAARAEVLAPAAAALVEERASGGKKKLQSPRHRSTSPVPHGRRGRGRGSRSTTPIAAQATAHAPLPVADGALGRRSREAARADAQRATGKPQGTRMGVFYKLNFM